MPNANRNQIVRITNVYCEEMRRAHRGQAMDTLARSREVSSPGRVCRHGIVQDYNSVQGSIFNVGFSSNSFVFALSNEDVVRSNRLSRSLLSGS